MKTPARQIFGKLTRMLGILCLFTTTATRAADGSWNVDADGTWTTPGNWLGNVVADGAGSTARFTNDTTTAHTITLSTAQTNGNLAFSDGDPISTPGGWIISGSSLTLTNSAATPIITVDPINNVDATNDAIINSTLTSLQGFVKKGAGTLTLTAANIFSNSVQVDEGILDPINAASISTGNRAVIFNGGGVRVFLGGPTLTFTNQVLNTAIIISSNGNYDAYNGPWIGSGTIQIHSNSRLTPGGGSATAFAGFTGTIDLADTTGGNETRLNLGSGSTPYNLSAIILNCGSNGGRFDFRATVAPCRVLIGALLGGPSTRFQSSENVGGTSLFWEIGYLNTSTVFDGVIANRNGAADRVGHLVKVGTGKLTLTGSSTYTGVTTISNGVLALTGTAALTGATNYITVLNPGSFDVSGLSTPFTLSTSQFLAGNGVVTGEVAMTSGTIAPGTPGATGSLSFSNNLSLDGTSTTTTNLFKAASGVNDQIRIAGNLTLTSTIAVRVIPTGPVIPNGTYILYQWGGTLTGDVSNLALEYPTQPGTFSLSVNLVTHRIVLQVSGVPSANNLVWRGDGSANAWDLATANWRNAGVASLFNNGDKATFDDSGSNNVPVDISSSPVTPSAVIVNATKPYTIGSTAAAGIAGTISLAKSNTGVLTITADNSYSSGTLIASGTVQVGDGSSSSGTLGSGIITNNATLVYNRPDVVTVAPVITGSGVVVEQGAGGTLTLNNANTYTGGTVVSNGTLRLTAYTPLGTGNVTMAGGTLEIVPSGSATVGLSNNVNVVANSTLQYDATGTFAAVAFGALTGNPGVTLNVIHSGGGPDRLRLYGNFSYNANLNLNDSGIALAPYAAAGSQSYNGLISGSGQIVNRAGGATIYLNAQNTYSGGTTLTTSSLGLGVDSISSGGVVISGPVGINNLTLANEGPGVNGNATVLASGGPRVLENPIVYPNNTNFTFIIGGSSNLTFTGTYSLAGLDGNGGVSRIVQADNTALSTLAGVIDDAGLDCGIISAGTGILRLSALNTYNGPTTVSNGTLQVNGRIGPGDVNVWGGSLGGTGNILGRVTIQSGGTLAPGASIGTLTISSNLTIAGNLNIEVNKSVSPSNDFTFVSGTLANTGTGVLTVTNLGPALAVGNSFKLFNKAVANGAAITVTGAGATWNNNLAGDGSISVASIGTASIPGISSVSINGSNIIFSGTNGTAGSTYYVQSTTNLGIGLSNWTRLSTNTFAAGGTFSVTNALIPGETKRFYLLQLP